MEEQEPIPIFLDDMKEYECKCCRQMYSSDNMTMCTNTNQTFNHVICYECLQGYLELIIDQKTAIKCMMSAEGCNGKYHDKDIQKVLSETQYDKYIDCRNVEEALQFANILENYHICPFCSKYGVIIEDFDNLDDKNLQMDCQQCKKNWCIKCRGESHIPDPCGKLKTQNTEIIRRVIEKTIDDVAIHKCPKCFLEFNKEDGCNLITCSSCGAYSCYICGILLKPKNGLKYWHFKGHSESDSDALCPLFNSDGKYDEATVKESNINFDNIRIINALKNLLMVNDGNTEIFKLLYEELTNKGYTIITESQVDGSKKYIITATIVNNKPAHHTSHHNEHHHNHHNHHKHHNNEQEPQLNNNNDIHVANIDHDLLKDWINVDNDSAINEHNRIHHLWPFGNHDDNKHKSHHNRKKVDLLDCIIS